MTGLNELANLAQRLNTGKSDNGKLSWLELGVENAEQLLNVLKTARENGIIVMRGRSEQRIAKLSLNYEEAVFINLSKMSRVIEHVREDQVISVETGITLSELQKILRNHGQWLPVEYINDEISLADIIDSGDGGFLEGWCGGVKQLVLGLHIGLASGESVKTGGKIVKNVTGYDLGKLFTGARGWLGIPYMVHLRLFSHPQERHCFVACADKPQDMIELSSALAATGLPIYCLEAFDTRLPEFCLAKARSAIKGQGKSKGTAFGGISKETNENLARALEELTRITKGSRAALIVSTRGHRDVVDEIAKALRMEIESFTNKISELTPESADCFEPLCSELLSQSEYETIEVNVPSSVMKTFFQTWWLQEGKPPWTARTATGRLRVAIQKTNFESLRTFADSVKSEELESFPMANPTESFEFQVSRMPHGVGSQDALAALMNRLKDNFDPSHILNPLVQFHPAESKQPQTTGAAT